MNILLKIFIYTTIFSFIIGLLKDIYINLLKNKITFNNKIEDNNIELLEMTMKINKIVDYGFDEEII